MPERQLNLVALKEAMGRAGINSAAIAKKLNISREAVSNWVNGENQPKPDKLLKLASFLKVRYNDLLTPQVAPNLPVVAFRMRHNRRATDAHIHNAQMMGQLLQPLAKYLPFDTLMAPQLLRQPETGYEYLQVVAQELRREIGVGPEEEIGYEKFIETLRARQVVTIPVLWGVKNDHENALHIFLPDSQTTWIYLNLDSSVLDFKFWMAHELGHVLTPALRGNEGEDFADALAASLLFPKVLAEKAYSDLVSKPRVSSRLSHIRDLAIYHEISPITVYKQINAYAKSTQQSEFDYNIYGMATNVSNASKSIRQTLLGNDSPDVLEYIRIAEKEFGTPFFGAVQKYLLESGKSAGYVGEILDISIVDAKAISTELHRRAKTG